MDKWFTCRQIVALMGSKIFFRYCLDRTALFFFLHTSKILVIELVTDRSYSRMIKTQAFLVILPRANNYSSQTKILTKAHWSIKFFLSTTTCFCRLQTTHKLQSCHSRLPFLRLTSSSSHANAVYNNSRFKPQCRIIKRYVIYHCLRIDPKFNSHYHIFLTLKLNQLK